MNPIQRVFQCLLLLAALSSLSHAYYAPDQGRWLNRDPIGESGGINLHGFVNNNPIGAIDVAGLAYKIVHVGDFNGKASDMATKLDIESKTKLSKEMAKALREELEGMTDFIFDEQTKNGITFNVYFDKDGKILEQPKVEPVKVSRQKLIEWMKYEEASEYSSIQESKDLSKEDLAKIVRSQNGNEDYNYDFASLIIHGLPGQGCRLGDGNRFPHKLAFEMMVGMQFFEYKALTSCGAVNDLYVKESVIQFNYNIGWAHKDGCQLNITPAQAGHSFGDGKPED